MRSVWVGSEFNNRMIAKEKARMLALGGINLAISQLTLRKPLKKEAGNLPEADLQDKIQKDFLKRVWTNLNKWQTFNLDEKFDEMDGQIKICITCENGKININEAFDFEKQEFKNKFKRLLQGLHIKGKLAEGEILKRLTDFLKERKKKLDDISELVDVQGLEHLDVFYRPPEMPVGKKHPEPNADVLLQDLFTIWTDDEKIELLFCSDSLAAVLGFARRPLANDAQVLKEKYSDAIANFKKDWGANWDVNWENVIPFFGVQPKFLKEFEDIFSKEFGPTAYSVISCGKVEGVEQKLLAILKQIEKKEEQVEQGELTSVNNKANSQSAEEKKENSEKSFKVVKMYWL